MDIFNLKLCLNYELKVVEQSPQKKKCYNRNKL